MTGKGLEKGNKELEKYGAFSVPKDGENGTMQLEWLRAVCPLSLIHTPTAAASAGEVTSYGLTAAKNKWEKSMALHHPHKLVWKNTTKNAIYYSAQKLPPKLSCEENKSIFLKM